MCLRKSVQYFPAVFPQEKFYQILPFFFFFCLAEKNPSSVELLKVQWWWLKCKFSSWALLRHCITLTLMMFVWFHQASLSRKVGVCCLVICHSTCWRSDLECDILLEQIVAFFECLSSNSSTGSSRLFRWNQLWFSLSSCFLVQITLCQDGVRLILQKINILERFS